MYYALGSVIDLGKAKSDPIFLTTRNSVFHENHQFGNTYSHLESHSFIFQNEK